MSRYNNLFGISKYSNRYMHQYFFGIKRYYSERYSVFELKNINPSPYYY